jgi:L,D-transpeptidase ErfK/SrfK
VEALIFALLLGSTVPTPHGSAPSAPFVVDQSGEHVVVPGDTLLSIAARRGVDAATIALENGLEPRARLEVGTLLRVPAVHIAPPATADGIVVNLPQRMLFLWEDGRLVRSWPVAVGGTKWKTPRGAFRVAEMEEDPTWDVPVSIQREMRSRGQRVRKKVPPGRGNPLGSHWVGLNVGNIGIHGTNAPSSIYRFATHGCIRMHPDDVAELFGRVTLDTPVHLVYEPALLTVNRGEVMVEAHPDPYGLARDAEALVRAQAEELGVEDRVDWTAVRKVLRRREGVARAVGRVDGPDVRAASR